MGTSSGIIELFGLPACGKTTLVYNIKAVLVDEGKKVAVREEISKEFRNADFTKKIMSILSIPLWSYIKIFCHIRPNDRYSFNACIEALKISITYSFIKKYTRYDYILIDHGIMQNTVSLLRNVRPQKMLKLNNLFERVINKEVSVYAFVYCDVSIESAIKRISLRNRQFGSLDDIVRLHPESISQAYREEKDKFEFALNCIPEQIKKYRLFQLDMEKNEQVLTNTLYGIIKYGDENEN